MDMHLRFLEDKDIITTLLLLYDEGMLSRGKLMQYMGIKNRALYDRTGVLKKHQLITGKTSLALTPRGRFIATHLHNMNFYMSGGKQR